MQTRPSSGFTLVELSIVLVIIGLIIGGVLVGKDLVNAATVRAQITQLEKYNSATNTFKGKYGGLPGDLPDPAATQFGFGARGTYPGMGDGNGIIEGINSPGAVTNQGTYQDAGETVAFWEDLSKASLIDGNFSTALEYDVPNAVLSGPATIAKYLPLAKIGNNNSIFVWSCGPNTPPATERGTCDGHNYFGIAVIESIDGTLNQGYPTSNVAVSVQQAYSIDRKIDDGLPGSGRVTALNGASINPRWSLGYGNTGALGYSTSSPSSSTCFDTGGVASLSPTYTMSVAGGANLNCYMSIAFQ